jgi:hypothetical protein
MGYNKGAEYNQDNDISKVTVADPWAYDSGQTSILNMTFQPVSCYMLTFTAMLF